MREDGDREGSDGGRDPPGDQGEGEGVLDHVGSPNVGDAVTVTHTRHSAQRSRSVVANLPVTLRETAGFARFFRERPVTCGNDLK